MTKEECMEALSKHANIKPVITSTGLFTACVYIVHHHMQTHTQMHICTSIHTHTHERERERLQKNKAELSKTCLSLA